MHIISIQCGSFMFNCSFILLYSVLYVNKPFLVHRLLLTSLPVSFPNELLEFADLLCAFKQLPCFRGGCIVAVRVFLPMMLL